MIVNLDMDAAVRLVERKQAERDRIAADLQDRAILADIAVAQYKRQVAERAAACGSALVIGHHPHVVQGFTTVSGMPVVYSLGNCSFGGTTRAKDSDALAVQAVLCFEEGELQKTELHFHPISMTSDPKYNNYSPRLLEGEEAERVLRKMEKSTGNAPGPWSEGAGAVTVWAAAD